MQLQEVKKTILFKDMTDREFEEALSRLGAHEQTFEKGEMILRAGDTTSEMGIILAGSVTIESNDLWGNRAILNLAEAGDFFAEVYALFGNEPLLIDVCANEDCRILFLKTAGLTGEMKSSWQIRLTRSLLLIASRKNLVLSGRAFHTSPKSIRGRLMAYLDSMSRKKGSRSFDIPFDRQQLADYLNVERTALSKELGKMKKEGLIDCRKNHFRIL